MGPVYKNAGIKLIQLLYIESFSFLTKYEISGQVAQILDESLKVWDPQVKKHSLHCGFKCWNLQKAVSHLFVLTP